MCTPPLRTKQRSTEGSTYCHSTPAVNPRCVLGNASVEACTRLVPGQRGAPDIITAASVLAPRSAFHRAEFRPLLGAGDRVKFRQRVPLGETVAELIRKGLRPEGAHPQAGVPFPV